MQDPRDDLQIITHTPVPQSISPNTDFPLLTEAVEALQTGGVVGYPTETVWGLAAHPAHPQAIERLYLVKGREAQKPVQVSCLDLHAAQQLAPWSAALEALSVFWPGPLTVVTRAHPDCSPLLAPGGWVGLRLPDHALAQRLLGGSGGLLATTSLNPSGRPAATTLEQARAYALADLLVTPRGTSGPPPQTTPALASTVLRLPDNPTQPARLLRLGALSAHELAPVLAGVGLGLALPAEVSA